MTGWPFWTEMVTSEGKARLATATNGVEPLSTFTASAGARGLLLATGRGHAAKIIKEKNAECRMQDAECRIDFCLLDLTFRRLRGAVVSFRVCNLLGFNLRIRRRKVNINAECKMQNAKCKMQFQVTGFMFQVTFLRST
jgi:hypothetical protein